MFYFRLERTEQLYVYAHYYCQPPQKKLVTFQLKTYKLLDTECLSKFVVKLLRVMRCVSRHACTEQGNGASHTPPRRPLHEDSSSLSDSRRLGQDATAHSS